MELKVMKMRYKIYKYGLIAFIVLTFLMTILVVMLSALLKEATVTYDGQEVFMNQENFDKIKSHEWAKGVQEGWKARDMSATEECKALLQQQSAQQSISSIWDLFFGLFK